MPEVKWRLRAGATWRGKLEAQHPNHGKLVPVPPRWQKRFGRGSMVIPRPLDVDAAMRKPRKGRLITQSQVRELVAEVNAANCACPMTTGIFMKIVAEAAEEDARSGKKRITPYWRTVRDDGTLNDKFPGGTRAQAKRLRQEGFAIEAGRGKPRVRDFERFLVKL